MSGAGRSSRVCRKPPPSPTLEASGPVPRAFQRSRLRTLLNSARSVVPRVYQIIGIGRVVLEPLADAGEVGDDVDAVLAQVGGRADAGEHQQVRAVHRAAAEQHLAGGRRGDLAAADAVGHPDGALALDDDPGGERAGLDVEVVAVAGGLEVGLVHRPAAAVVAGHLVEPGALLLGAVEVVGRLHPGADGALHPQVGQLVGVAPVLDVERAVLAVVRRAEAGVALGADEVRAARRRSPSRWRRTRRARRRSRRALPRM